MRLKKLTYAAIALLAMASDALAQGCSMCYASAAQEDAGAQQALNLGILVLLIPPVLLFAGVLVTAVRRRDEDPQAADAPTARGSAN
jgi:hypothetical protein